MSPHPLPCCPERSPPWSDHRQEKSRPLAEQRLQAARSGRWGPSGAGHWSWQLCLGASVRRGSAEPSSPLRRASLPWGGVSNLGGRCAEGHRACRHVGAPGSGQRVPVLSCGVPRGLWAFRPWGSAPWSLDLGGGPHAGRGHTPASRRRPSAALFSSRFINFKNPPV